MTKNDENLTRINIIDLVMICDVNSLESLKIIIDDRISKVRHETLYDRRMVKRFRHLNFNLMVR